MCVHEVISAGEVVYKVEHKSANKELCQSTITEEETRSTRTCGMAKLFDIQN